jgi:hypothetical protein
MGGPVGASRSGSRTASESRQAESTTTLATGCVNPIRLRGFVQRISAETGEVLALLGSPGEPIGTLLVACKDRRASCCAVCSRLYERDAYHLIATGLRGGKGVPELVASHPCVMLTLTAPSFGAVHRNRDDGQRCQCGECHGVDDPQLGIPIDHRLYRYADQVIWNHYAPELWKRTVQAIRRGLAQAIGVSRSKLSQIATVRFAKVAEFQRRGVVHYHAIIRVDGADGPNTPPPAGCTTSLLEEVVQAATETTSIAVPNAVISELLPAAATTVRWGRQRDVVALDHETSTKAAGYIAKYATKATEMATGGIVVKPIRSRNRLDGLNLGDHAQALITTAWRIGERTGLEGFKRWAHQFGYGGHTLTKSRQYSLTFAELRATRNQWRRTANGEGNVVTRAQLVYSGRGYGHRVVVIHAHDDRNSRRGSDEGLD